MSAVKLAIPDSRMFFVVSFEYRTEVLTIFRTFPLVPGFRSGSNSSNDIRWKTERRTIGDVISRKILPRRSSGQMRMVDSAGEPTSLSAPRRENSFKNSGSDLRLRGLQFIAAHE